MSKIVFSKTQRFAQIRDAITTVCLEGAHKQVRNNNQKIVEKHIDSKLPQLHNMFPEIDTFTDTDTRHAAKIAIYQVLDSAKSLPQTEQLNYINANIDCSMVLNDILHMVTCDNDKYEYEGKNAVVAIHELLGL